MTLQEAYASVGGSYESMLRRLGSEASVRKFCTMFLQDESYKNIRIYVEEDKLDEAFRMAHTLKGSSQMLGFEALHQSSNALTEALRHKQLDRLEELMAAVDADYAQVYNAFSTL